MDQERFEANIQSSSPNKPSQFNSSQLISRLVFREIKPFHVFEFFLFSGSFSTITPENRLCFLCFDRLLSFFCDSIDEIVQKLRTF